MTFFYFAYGSNMLPARLKARCKSARIRGAAIAKGFDMEFSKPGKDASGKVTLIGARETATPGVLFEIDRSDLNALDRAEGAGFGYDRADDFIAEITGTGERITATALLAHGFDDHNVLLKKAG